MIHDPGDHPGVASRIIRRLPGIRIGSPSATLRRLSSFRVTSSSDFSYASPPVMDGEACARLRRLALRRAGVALSAHSFIYFFFAPSSRARHVAIEDVHKRAGTNGRAPYSVPAPHAFPDELYLLL